ncbi:MAG TPA: hypothetical protein VN685_08045 [Rhizomicrobium sp.]|nr:hypothetical protein [Rhizomicrobium sp.]
MGNLELLEKAFAIADSGEVSNMAELRKMLIASGISVLELQQFHGQALARQLSERISKSAGKRHKIGVPFTRQ